MRPQARYKRPWLYEKQKEAIFTTARYAVIEATTKSGKTVGCLVWLTEQALKANRPGRNFWWIAPTFPMAKIAYERLKRSLPREIFKKNDTELRIILHNGSNIWFKGAEKSDSLYGEDVFAAVIDEATRCREESWFAVRSTLTATRGPIRIIGNVKGRKNWAYRMARKAEAGEPDMAYAKITAYDAVEAGILDMEEIDDARRQLPEQVFRELYLAEPADDGGNPFGLAAIEAQLAPLSENPPIAWGWDLAKSQDWTVGIALDQIGHTCQLSRFQIPWEETITRIRNETAGLPALVDSTGVGDPILEALQKNGGENFQGFHFSSSSKQQLMEGLAVAIQQGQIFYPDGVIRDELDSYEYEYTRTGVKYTAPQGMHDDCVCSLALVNRLVMVEPQQQGIVYASELFGEDEEDWTVNISPF